MNLGKGSKESPMALIALFPEENFGGVALTLAADVGVTGVIGGKFTVSYN